MDTLATTDLTIERLAPTMPEADSRVGTAMAAPPQLRAVAPAALQVSETTRELAQITGPSAPRKRNPARRWAVTAVKQLATLGVALVAIVMALVTWDYYVTAPWTRDGRVRVQVASVAPQISGQIVELRVGDNQYVHKGEVLYVIDPFDFEVALREGKAQAQQRAADLQVKEVQSERRQRLSSLATTPEEQQTSAGAAVQAKAVFEAAQQQDAQAEINLARVCVGDRVEAKLMGYAQPILGHVATVTRGIGVPDGASGTQGLPNVNPVYTWVRLAQRVPVRIAIDSVPPGIPLVSGMTATVTVKDAGEAGDRPWLDRAVAEIETRLFDVLDGPPARPGCIPAITTERATPATLPVDEQKSAPTPEQINPGLAPGMSTSPRNKS